jgi:hypothetical protein
MPGLKRGSGLCLVGKIYKTNTRIIDPMTIFIGEIVNDDARIQLALADSSIACTL